MNTSIGELQIGVWYLLAGVIIGFATSTLWEWLYFRRKRIQPTPDPYALTPRGTPSPKRAPDEIVVEQTPRPAPAGARLDIETMGATPPIVTPTAQVSAHLSPAVSAAPVKAVSVQRSRGYPDDLTQIAGIDRSIQEKLYRAQIFTWHHVATSEVDYLRQVAQPPASARVEEWPIQARALAESQNRTNAFYSGPLPEDLTQIADITPRQMELLYKMGICTARQLAAASRDELEALFAGAPGGPFDYDRWLAEAARAAG